jgi:release factor glutamine methyltransferase
MAELLDVSLPALALHKETVLTPAQIGCFEQGFGRLMHVEPLQYIIGKAHFYGLELIVNPSVLIPRPETEGLVEWIFNQNPGKQRVLEIGTGSGAISLALQSLNPSYKITATDISLPALKVARHNAKRLGYAISFDQADLFPGSINNGFDLIVSNPPYVSTSEYRILSPEVRLYEPKLALAAGRDGLSCYRKIISKAARYLLPGGKIYLEIGEHQGSALASLAAKHSFSSFVLKQDLAGKDRYVCLSMSS